MRLCVLSEPLLKLKIQIQNVDTLIKRKVNRVNRNMSEKRLNSLSSKQYSETVYLRHGVKFNHSSCKRLGISTERWDEAKHGSIEGSINLG